MTQSDQAAGEEDGDEVTPSLAPISDLDRLPDGAWLTSGFNPRFEVAIDIAQHAGAWVECEAEILSDLDVVTPLLHIRRADPDQPRIARALPTDPRGRARWIGRLPDDLEGLRFQPMTMAGTFRIGRFRLRRLPLAAVLARAALASPLQLGRALYWRALGLRVRSRNRLERAFERPNATSYAAWVKANDTFSKADLAGWLRESEGWADPPLISVAMPVYNPVPRDLARAIASIRAQIYPHWELRIADDASNDPRVARVLERAARSDARIHVVRRPINGHISAATNTALAGCEGAFTALMDHDDLLPRHALFFVAKEFVEHPEADLVYTDEDKIDGRGRRYMPHLKSDWNEELFLTQNYINHLGTYRTELLRQVGFRPGFEGSQDHDMILRFLDETHESRIRHIPRILYHWRNHRSSASFSEKSLDKAVAARRRALEDHVRRRGWDAVVTDGPTGANRLMRRLPDPPPEVSVIVPTRDRAGLLRMAAEGVLKGTTYGRLRLTIIDNGSVEPDTAALFAELRLDARVTILPMPGPFNFSGLNNAAVATVESELVCFLNNDIEVVGGDWLAEMVSSLTEGVAAVGARLLYPDSTVQHAGIVLGGGGVAGHAHPDRRAEDPGYFGRAVLPQYMSAVTAACMLVRRDAFLAVGGFDAEHLRIAFNDVDLCLKLGAAGHKIVWTPYATLIHHESASRGLDVAPEKRDRFQREIATMHERWGPALSRDPYYNPNFALDFADYRLRGATPAGPRPSRHG